MYNIFVGRGYNKMQIKLVGKVSSIYLPRAPLKCDVIPTFSIKVNGMQLECTGGVQTYTNMIVL